MSHAYSIREALEEGNSERILSEQDPFYALLHTAAPYSHMPELYELIGPELFAKFLDTFEGMKLDVPSKKHLSTVLRKQSAFYEYHVLRTPSDVIIRKYGVQVSPSERWMADLYELYRAGSFTVRKDVSVSTSKRRPKKIVRFRMARNNFPGGNFPPRSLVPFPGAVNPPPPPANDIPDEPQGPTPSDLLEAMSRWLVGGTVDGDIDMMRGYLTDHRKRHEVYTVGLANARAVWLSKISTALWDNLFDLVFDPRAVRTMSPKDRTLLLGIAYKMFSSESEAQWNFYKNGPAALPPLEDSSEGGSSHGGSKQAQLLDSLDKMDPQSREKVRNAFATFMKLVDKAKPTKPEAEVEVETEDSEELENTGDV